MRPRELTRSRGGQGVNRESTDHERSENDFGEHNDREK